MGIRLYPNTKNVASLETICGVPAGTAARLEAVEARHAEELKPLAGKAPWERQDVEYRQWCEINDDAALGDYHAFLLYGWGKFNDPHGVTVRDGERTCSGSVSDPVKVVLLLRPNGLDETHLALMEGVHWC
jgi:hypothetical protein